MHTFFTLTLLRLRHWRHYSGHSGGNPLIWLRHPYVIALGALFAPCQIVDRSEWLNRISRYISCVCRREEAPLRKPSHPLSKEIFNVQICTVKFEFLLDLLSTQNYSIKSFVQLLLDLLIEHFHIDWTLEFLSVDSTAKWTARVRVFLSITTTSAARLKSDVAENPKPFRFTRSHCAVTNWTVCVTSWSFLSRGVEHSECVKGFQGHENDSLMIFFADLCSDDDSSRG